MLIIPCRPDLPHYDMQVDLDGTTYVLEFKWNSRESSWYMTVSTVDGDPIVASVKVLPGEPLVARSNDPRRPPGYFFALDTASPNNNPPGLNDLGDRVVLVYVNTKA